MARLILTFKGRLLHVYRFKDIKQVFIGRDTDNVIQIDSLAVAPTHAVVSFGEGDTDEAHIELLDKSYSLAVNSKPIDKATLQQQLQDGDSIAIGKHIIQYVSDVSNKVDHDESVDKLYARPLEANMQILSGKNIGRIYPIKKALTRLKKPGTEMDIAVIARRKEGYFLSPLDPGSALRVNKDIVNDKTVKLEHGDTLEIDNDAIRFFLVD